MEMKPHLGLRHGMFSLVIIGGRDSTSPDIISVDPPNETVLPNKMLQCQLQKVSQLSFIQYIYIYMVGIDCLVHF